ncbi:sperm-specific antigen 2 isoform X2 [Alligator sinensis]|uniref:Sperm-specific antigen 2 isoform X2 n=1 Tax=Alligator sinensis TaxID=38654 RepID=A0A1U8D158_ALLSI|nr:sperm-specific antigen 2 isoform X2 [Alligator sinensis]
MLKGMLMRNGGSFEDDLSLGAEANHLQSDAQMETCNGMLAKEKRLQFRQKGRSMNSTGSGKSSATVSSVSELLELYEEDPEEVLYNLGFGRDEPDIASKIPPRFFNSSSFARGIDIKVFLNAQMQRMEVENPNFALTSRFRQIEVLTTVANAFSSLYSQVSGTPLQKIGTMNSVSSNKEASSPPPLNRSNTANRLMKTLSKLNLCGAQQAGESSTISSPVEKGKSPTAQETEEYDFKNESKLPKHFRKKDSPSFLATVKEEMSNNQFIITDKLHAANLPAGVGGKQDETGSHADTKNNELPSHQNRLSEESGIADSSNFSSDSTSSELESNIELQNMPKLKPGKEPCGLLIANPSITNLMLQQKDSFEMEEIQSTEGELPHIPTPYQLALIKSRKDQLLRTASQHSDSSGFAEDPSTDCFSLNPLQVHDSLQAMGSSADSCDSETTVTSHSEELRTPIAKELPYFHELEEEEEEEEEDEKVLPEMEGQKLEVPSEKRTEGDEANLEHETDQNQRRERNLSHTSDSAQRNLSIESEETSTEQKESEVLEEDSDESDLEKSSELEFPQYKTHHILKSMASIESTSSSTSSADRVHVALQRAQMKISSTSGSRVGRTLLKSKDLLLKQRHRLAESGYPLRRSQSLPTALLNPVKVVSSVNVRLSPGKETLCSPPSFTYKYTPEEEEEEDLMTEDKQLVNKMKDSPPPCKSTFHVAPSSMKKETTQSGLTRLVDESSHSRLQSCPLHIPAHMSQSTCSLHSLYSDWQDRPLCEHMRTLSTHSVPSISGSSCSALASPFGCPYSPRHVGYSPRPHAINPPSTVEMQLRRVLHDIRNSLQNLSQYPAMRGHDLAAATSYSTQRSSILPLYENTFQELQVVRRSLNLFRTQMMDLELTMLRQQTTVYQHMTEEERYEADQLQSLRKSVRMELQELETQLEERLLALEEQLRTLHMSSPYRSQPLMGMYGSRSTDNLSCPSPLNVIEPVSELIREQSFLKSELGLGLGDLGLETLPAEGSESVFSHGNSDSSSVCSSHAGRKAGGSLSEITGKSKMQSKRVYRASVALTPTPPARPGSMQQAECPEEYADSRSEVEQKLEKVPFAPSVDEIHRSVENEELQQVIREIKESIVGEIRREIVSGLLAAVSAPSRSANTKQDT